MRINEEDRTINLLRDSKEVEATTIKSELGVDSWYAKCDVFGRVKGCW